MARAKRPSSPRPVSARAYALVQLDRIEAEGAFVGFGTGEEGADARRARQVLEYVAGVTRWRRWLDFLIDHFYRGRPDRLEPRLRQILRVGLYDLLFLHTPSHAALHEAVALAKRQVRSGAGGLVNGILRSVLRAQAALPLPATGDVVEDLAIRQSHPTWMVRRWAARYGLPETEALLTWNNTRPAFGVRPNLELTTPDAFRARLDALEAAWTPSPYLDDFVRVEKLQPILRAGLLDEGYCAVQDEAAALVVRLLDPQPGETVVDGCAAPGGKTLYAAQRMQDRGRILALDVHEGRIGLIARAAQQQGYGIITAEAADLRMFARAPAPVQADRVLLDVPCSGLGVLAKRADLRWNRGEDEISVLTTLQDELLQAAARLVRPGGLLVYSTCTIEPEENEDRVATFLQQNPTFSVEPAGGFVPDVMVTPEGYYAALPHRDHIDGAFGARLRLAG